jgi:hypothetical protein
MNSYNALLERLAGKFALRPPMMPDRTLAVGDAEFLLPVAQPYELTGRFSSIDPVKLASKDTLGGFEGFIGEGQPVTPDEMTSGAFNLGPAVTGGATPWSR